ncbi:MAG: phosphoserine phosphatase SerB [Rickettsiales bacterium]|nr:phosphoserine phosphatase SerB [Rickettsiales bacterium]|tara:strand:- start:214 stop:1113 length:900 start_codon:yes stop_codon:yes gene_type:complete
MSHNTHVTTLVAPANTKLEESNIDACLQALQLTRENCTIEWLEEDKACDLLHNLPLNEAQAKLADASLRDSIDCVSQPTAHRRKKLLISDMDSTMIQQECIDELAAALDLKERVADITEKAMNGELDFKDALRERVALLQGLHEDQLEEVYKHHISFMPGARELVQTMKAHGAYCLLVSGGFRFFTNRVAEALGFDEDQSNMLEIFNHVLTGKVVEPILDKESKRAALEQSVEKSKLEKVNVLAVGDGANDLPMLLAAGLGVAYKAKPTVQAQAKACINHGDLTSLLYVQGYRRNEWAW